MKAESSIVSEKKSYKSWRKTEEANGISKSVSVNECENGFIIEISKYGCPRDEPNGKYIDDCKKYISTKNPLESEKEIESEEVNVGDGILSAIKSIFE